jgi:MFS family permease
VGGQLADRYGRRPVMTVSLTAAAAAILLLAAAQPIWLIAVAMVLFGLVVELHRPALNAMVIDVVRPQERTRAFGLLHWATNLGTSVAMLGGGALTRGGFTVVFGIDALTTLLVAVLIWRLLRSTPDPGRNGRPGAVPADPLPVPAPVPAQPIRAPGGRLLVDGRLVRFSALTFLGFLIYFQGFSTLSLAITDKGLSVADYGIIAACNGVTVAVVQPVTAGLLGRLPVDPLLAAGYLLVGAGFALTSVADTVLGLAGTVVLWSVGEIILAAVGSAVVAGLAPPDRRGRYLGWYNATLAAAFAVAPLVGTAAYRMSSDTMWMGCGVLGVILAVAQMTMDGTDATEPVVASRPRHRHRAGPAHSRRR